MHNAQFRERERGKILFCAVPVEMGLLTISPNGKTGYGTWKWREGKDFELISVDAFLTQSGSGQSG